MIGRKSNLKEILSNLSEETDGEVTDSEIDSESLLNMLSENDIGFDAIIQIPNENSFVVVSDIVGPEGWEAEKEKFEQAFSDFSKPPFFVNQDDILTLGGQSSDDDGDEQPDDEEETGDDEEEEEEDGTESGKVDDESLDAFGMKKNRKKCPF